MSSVYQPLASTWSPPRARAGKAATLTSEEEDFDSDDGEVQPHATSSTSSHTPAASFASSWLLHGLACVGAASLALLLLLSLQCAGVCDLSSSGRGVCAALLSASSDSSPPPPAALAASSGSSSLLTSVPLSSPASLPSSPLSLSPVSTPAGRFSSAFPLQCSWSVLRDELHYLTHSEHVELQRAVGLRPAVPEPRLLIIGMTGSVAGKERMRTALDTWLKGAVASRAVFFSDVDDSLLHMVTLPSMKGYAEFRHAQHRQLRGLRWLFNTTDPPPQPSLSPAAASDDSTPRQPPLDPDHEYVTADAIATSLRGEALRGELDWVLLCDDDTFINVPALLSLLRENTLDAQLPLMFGNVFDRVTGNKDLAFSAGGAGIIMSAVTARLLASALYTPLCPDVYLNDDSIGQCAVRLNVSNVHSALLMNGLEGMRWKTYDLTPHKHTAISWHYITDDLAQQLQQEIDRRQAVLRQCVTNSSSGKG